MSKGADLSDIMSKLEGLLNMTVENGCTPEEAATAAEVVEKILTKYNLDRSQIKIGQAKVEPDMKRSGKGYGKQNRFRSSRWINTIAKGISRLYYCEAWCYRDGYVTFFGEAHDVLVVETVLTWLVDQGHQRCKYVWANRTEFGVDHLSYLPYESSFLEGYGSGISEKVHEMIENRAKKTQGVAGLVVDKKAQIEEFINQLYPQIAEQANKPIRKTRPRKEKHRKGADPSAYFAGVEQGQKTSITKQETLNASS